MATGFLKTESMKKFTPAPWKIGFMMKNGEIDGLAVFEEKAQPGETVNAICLVASKDNVQPVDEHNARVISAAPEMFDLLDSILKHAVWEGEITYALIKQTKDVLAKARGKEV